MTSNYHELPALKMFGFVEISELWCGGYSEGGFIDNYFKVNRSRLPIAGLLKSSIGQYEPSVIVNMITTVFPSD